MKEESELTPKQRKIRERIMDIIRDVIMYEPISEKAEPIEVRQILVDAIRKALINELVNPEDVKWEGDKLEVNLDNEKFSIEVKHKPS